MARRDNQGIQIAMIVFILTTLLFMVTTYFGYDSATALKGEVAELQSSLADRDSALSAAEGLATRLKSYVGVDPTMDDAGTETAVEEALNQFGQGLPTEGRNFLGIAEHMSKRLQDLGGELAKMTQDNRDLRGQLENERKNAVATLQQVKSEAELAHNQQIEITTEHEQYRQQAADTQQKLTQERDKAKDELLALTQNTEAQAKELQDRLELSNRTRDEKARQLREALGGTPDRFDGEILGSVPSSQTVFVNRGSADGLRPKITFGVYDADYSNARGEKAKATVEVTKILGPHHAEARVTDRDPVHPIVRGDHVYSVVWSPGTRIGIALVGEMDIDKDGQDDRQFVRNLIKLNGGQIDAEDGGNEVKGEVTFNTRYVVVGDAVLDGKENPAGQKIIEMARNLSVERMSLEELLELIGYAGRARTESYKGVLRPGDFAVEPHDDVTRSTTGKTSFSKREYLPLRSRPRSY